MVGVCSCSVKVVSCGNLGLPRAAEDIGPGRFRIAIRCTSWSHSEGPPRTFVQVDLESLFGFRFWSRSVGCVIFGFVYQYHVSLFPSTHFRLRLCATSFVWRRERPGRFRVAIGVPFPASASRFCDFGSRCPCVFEEVCSCSVKVVSWSNLSIPMAAEGISSGQFRISIGVSSMAVYASALAHD